MNIGEAKQEIKNTIRAYLQKDAAGAYRFPVVRQRPVLLMGPPGIGKTAIMEQIAGELGIGFVSYTMTHHTRQSAVGLPQIMEQTYETETFSVTRYTMSEIIASIYDAMAQSGCREGILFLDEINCVSDTLAPTMLQFLQNKTFGTHALPAGWLIAAAGNPPEYNKSVREFDIATLDRIRTIDIQPDTGVFLEYAAAHGLHGAVVSYLKLYPDRFYHVSQSEGRKYHVTARGWEDLSALLQSYEALEIPMTEEIISEFLHLPETSRAFSAYYQLYRKYDSDYRIPSLLAGDTADSAEKAALLEKADFVERFAVVQMLLHGIGQTAVKYLRADETAAVLHDALKEFLSGTTLLADFTAARRTAAETKRKFGLLSPAKWKQEQILFSQLDELQIELRKSRVSAPEALREAAQQFLNVRLQQREECIRETGIALQCAITWLRDALGQGRELTALLSGITASPVIMSYIMQHGCPEYLEECSCLQTSLAETDLRAACAEAE